GERVVPDSVEVRAALDYQAERLGRGLTGSVLRGRLRVDRLADRLAAAGRGQVQCAGTELDALAARARLAVCAALEGRGHDLARFAGQLEALSPLKVLARGYSLTQEDDTGAILRDAAS